MPDIEEDAVDTTVDAVEPEIEEGQDEAPEGEESEPEADEGEESEAPRRGETRQQRLANENRLLREQKAAAEAEARTLREMGSRQPDNSGEAARIRAEKIALMDPSERRIFEQDEVIKRLEQGQQSTQFMLADNNDRLAFERKTMKNSLFAKHADWVEQQLASERKQGRYPTREALALLKIGYDASMAMEKKPSKKLAEKKEQAASRVASSKGAATGGRSDVRDKADNSDSLDSLRQRILAREAAGDR